MRAYNGQGTVLAGGTVEVDITPPPGYQWEVNHIGISNNSTTNSTCSVFLNQRFICGSNIGNADSADGTPVPVHYGDTIRFVWNGASTGTVCNVTILVDESRVGSPLG